MARFVERSAHDRWTTTWKLLAFVAVIAGTVVVVYPWRGPLYAAVAVLLTSWLYVRLVSQQTGYRCANCRKVFQVPTTVNFFTMSLMGKNRDGTYYSYKSLTCPKCGKRTKARLVKKASAKAARGRGAILK